MTIQSKIEEIKNFIVSNDITELKNYINNNGIQSTNINNFNEILIFSIERNASLDIIKFILEQREDKNLNIYINSNNMKKVPLFEAIGNNKFEIADLLIENNADINFEKDNFKNDITFYLFNNEFINKKNLKYAFDKGLKSIYYKIVRLLIKSKNNDCIKVIYNHYKYKNSFIIGLLNIYKNNKISADNKLEVMKTKFLNEDKRIEVFEYMYKDAIEVENYEALKILFEYDSFNYDKKLKRIIKFDLLKHSLKLNDYNYIKKLLQYEQFNYKYFKYDEILAKVLSDKEDSKNITNIRKLLINTFINSSKQLESTNNSENIQNQKNAISYTNLILNIAIKNKNMEIMKYLINSKDYKLSPEDIRSADKNGVRPIITAFETNDFEIFEYIFLKSNDYNAKDDDGVPLLIRAIENNNFDYIFLIINEGIKNKSLDLNIFNNSENAPLILSYKKGYLNIFKYLFKYFDINNKDSSGHNILYYAVEKEDIEMIKNLIKLGINVDKDTLFNAISKDDYTIINILLESHQLVLNIKDSKGETPIINIIKYDINYYEKDELIKKLIKKGSDINIKDNNDNSPLIYAIKNKFKNIVKILIENGADINIINKEGDTPLICAIKNRYTKIVKILIDKGVDMNVTNKEGDTPLICAIKNECIEIIKILIDYGANIYKKDLNDYLPIDYAIKLGNVEMVELLYNKGCNFCNIKSTTFETFKNIIQNSDSYEIFELLMKNTNKFDIDMKDEINGNTLLHYAVINERVQIVRFLVLNCKADVHIKNNENKTVLNINSWNGNINKLLKYQ